MSKNLVWAWRACAAPLLTMTTNACAGPSSTLRQAEAPIPLARVAAAQDANALEGPPQALDHRPPRAPTDAELAGPVDRASLEAAAVARSPALVAGAHRVRALAEEARRESSLPAPELMAEIWQVPIARPYAVGDAGMIMLGLRQSFPAPGSLGMREEARAHEAKAEAAAVLANARELVRDVDHAFADYVEATLRHRAHLAHRGVLAKMLDVAKARYAAGAPLSDVTQTDLELARLDADLATEARSIETARAKLDGLLAREPEAPLGPPVIDEPSSVHLPAATIVARGRAARPEIAAAEERREAAGAVVAASRREAKVPSFSVGALYFAPVGPMPENGFGASFSMSLPWLSGERRHGAAAENERAAAAAADVEATRIAIGTDAAVFASKAATAERRYAILEDRALPASRRALDAAQAGYAAGKTDALTMLAAARAVVDVEMDLVSARSALEHALADLDWAAGGRLPREPIAHVSEENGHER